MLCEYQPRLWEHSYWYDNPLTDGCYATELFIQKGFVGLKVNQDFLWFYQLDISYFASIMEWKHKTYELDWKNTILWGLIESFIRILELGSFDYASTFLITQNCCKKDSIFNEVFYYKVYLIKSISAVPTYNCSSCLKEQYQ